MLDEIKNEYKSVQSVRGMENRSIAKAQKEGGWELVDQAQGALRTQLNFRRVKPETFLSKSRDVFRGLGPAKQLAVVAAVVVLVLFAAIGIGTASAHDKSDTNAAVTAAKSTESASVKASPTPTQSKEADPVITVENNEELSALLKTGDTCDPSMIQFADKHQGQKIAFDGFIVNMQHHEKFNTRYDILLGPGNDGPNTSVGPAFKYDNVNMFDLNFTGKNIPSGVTAGDKFRFTATVVEYNPKQCLFFLTPVSTTAR